MQRVNEVAQAEMVKWKWAMRFSALGFYPGGHQENPEVDFYSNFIPIWEMESISFQLEAKSSRREFLFPNDFKVNT